MLPYRGERLRGAGHPAPGRRLGASAASSSRRVAEAVDAVLDNPDWLRLEGHTVAVLGAGAEMGPLPSLMRWGARVAAVDLDRPEIWKRVLTLAKDGAGTLVAPVRRGERRAPLDEAAGVDLLAEVPAVARLAGRAAGHAGGGQLRLRRRRHQHPGLAPPSTS